MTFSPNSLSFGDARRLRGSVPEVPRRVRRALKAFFDYLQKLAEAVRRVITDPRHLLSERVTGKPSLSTAPLVEALRRKEQAVLVKVPASQDCLQHAAPAVFTLTLPDWQPPHQPHQWLSISTTPGLSNVIDTKECAAMLAAAKVNHPEWLINGNRTKMQKAAL